MSETDIQRDIMTVLNDLPGVAIFRNNRGRKGHVKFGLTEGASDLIGWRTFVDFAQFLAVEVKQPGKKASKEQQKFIDRVNAAGGLAFVATSVEEALKKLRKGIKHA